MLLLAITTVATAIQKKCCKCIYLDGSYFFPKNYLLIYFLIGSLHQYLHIPSFKFLLFIMLMIYVFD